MSAAKEVLTLLKGKHFYLDTAQADPWNISGIISSNKSDNMISVACLRGDYSALHCVVEEFPSITPKRWGQQKKKVELFEFYRPSDLAHWMEKYMDSSTPFYPGEYDTYYAGLEDGLPHPI